MMSLNWSVCAIVPSDACVDGYFTIAVYNTQLRPVSITEHEYNALFTYNRDGNRVLMQVNEDDMGILSRYYIDNTYEIESALIFVRYKSFTGQQYFCIFAGKSCFYV